MSAVMKGMFTQGVAVLFTKPPELAELQELLADYDLFARGADMPWPLGSPGFAVDFLSDLNGKCIVEVCDKQWPDDMGYSQDDQELIGAWGLGFFGPCTQPGALGRAVSQTKSWPDAGKAVAQHRAFVRLLIGYTIGGGSEARLATGDECDPVDEFSWLIEVARQLLDHPDALCFFNPGGEVLMPAAFMDHFFTQWEERDQPPLEAAISVRLWHVDETRMLSDTVGFSQFNLPDHQVIFDGGKYRPGDIVHFQLNIGLYLLDHFDAIQDGHTVDGPGGKWRVKTREKPFFDPAREVMHWARN